MNKLPLNKLLTAFLISPTEINRTRLQMYIYDHPFSANLCTAVEMDFLKSAGFKLLITSRG